MVLFITEQGARLVKRGRQLLLYKNRERLFMYPLENIERLVLMGRVEASSAMLGLLMRSGIDTVFLTRDGRYKGRLVGETSKNIFLREAQFRRRQDPEFALGVARALVLAKLQNSRNFLRKRVGPLFQTVADRFQNAVKSARKAPTLAALQGIEGSFAALYFQQFAGLLKQPLGFQRRIKHPPTDPVNVLLSFGYTLLFNTVFGLVEAAGLDPYAGFYHQSRYGHPALVSDLMEPYRAHVVDALVVRLLNEGKITEAHFQKDDQRLVLVNQGIVKLVEAYHDRLQHRWKVGDQQKTTVSVLQEDVWAFAHYLEGKHEKFEPFQFK